MIIHNGIIVNEGLEFRGYIVIDGEYITDIVEGDYDMGHGVNSTGLASQIPRHRSHVTGPIIDAKGGYIIPGAIDDHVHFREPGMTDKGDILHESQAAVAGGVTSFMDMPNNKPAAITIELLERKFERAAEVSRANYSFYLGATNDNLNEITRLDPKKVCGLKVFMGSSTGNMLVDRRTALEALFEGSPTIIAAHCEDEAIIAANLKAAFERYGNDIPMALHPVIRSAEACYRSTAQTIQLAQKYNTHLHILHISTARELTLFSDSPLKQKSITAEVCPHHLWFSDEDYADKGTRIKCNPAIKTTADRSALRQALRDGLLDVVGTDHAPHTSEQKQTPYTSAPSGIPLIQHSLPMMFDMNFAPADIAKYMSHNPATIYKINNRGFLRIGYFADIAIIKKQTQTILKEDIKYKCGWSPLENNHLQHSVTHTIVNGQLAFENGQMTDKITGQRLTFNR